VAGSVQIAGLVDAANFTSIVLGANRIHFVRYECGAERYSGMRAHITVGGTAGTELTLLLCRIGDNGKAADVIWYSASIAADVVGGLIHNFSSGTKVEIGDFVADEFVPTAGESVWLGIWTEDLPVMRAIAAGSAKALSVPNPPWAVGDVESHYRVAGIAYGGAPPNPIPVTNPITGTVPTLGLLVV
jgi:hypothetical protein